MALHVYMKIYYSPTGPIIWRGQGPGPDQTGSTPQLRAIQNDLASWRNKVRRKVLQETNDP